VYGRAFNMTVACALPGRTLIILSGYRILLWYPMAVQPASPPSFISASGAVPANQPAALYDLYNTTENHYTFRRAACGSLVRHTR
jgi:hypothetical protein